MLWLARGMNDRPILVMGATGTVGRRVVGRLQGIGQTVRPAARQSSPRFDWNDSATWDPSLEGVGAAFVMAPDGVDIAPDWFDHARRAGVERLVLLSSQGIEEMGDQRLLSAEEAIKKWPGTWTIVRPDWFDQNFDEGVLRDAVMAGEVALPVGDMKQAFNDAEDIAAVMSTSLTGDGHNGQTYELSGPDALSFREATEIVSDASGRPVRFSGDADRYIEVMTGYGLERSEVLQQVGAFEALAAGGDSEVTDIVARLTGEHPIAFRDYATKAAEGGAWAG
jgi:uncharacterized protein YbjT (DUF2867 family)